MTISIAHLGPSGTYAEQAAMVIADWLQQTRQQASTLHPYSSIRQTLQAASNRQVDIAVVPVENSIEGSVTMTLDTLWQLDQLKIQWALDLPIVHALMSYANGLEEIQTVYSHPQALAQCQMWLEQHIPKAQLVPTSSTTEAIQHLRETPTAAAISSERAANIYQVPILACPINDHPDNRTRFWALSVQPSPGGNLTSLAFSVHDLPGALVKPLQVFADRALNLSRIESRPTKRLLGDYIFFVDLEANYCQETVQATLEALKPTTEILKILGSYDLLPRPAKAQERSPNSPLLLD